MYLNFCSICRILSRYYHCQRQADLRNAARTTIRLLESLIRLAQAHARLMFREFVTVQDAIVAVTCVECSMQNSALLGSMNALHTRFPDDPQGEYSRQATLVLKRLSLEDMVSIINEVPSTEHGGNVGDSGNDAENNVRIPDESPPNDREASEGLRNRENKGQSSSTDEENDKVVCDSEISIFNDFGAETSFGQLTGVFPISSSEVGTEDTVDEDSSRAVSEALNSPSRHKQTNNSENSEEDEAANVNTSSKSSRFPGSLRTIVNNKEDDSLKQSGHVLSKPSNCEPRTSQDKETNKLENSESDREGKDGNVHSSSKPFRFPASLRTTVNNQEDDALKTLNRKSVASISLEKTKKMIDMFSKKPLNGAGETVKENICTMPQTGKSRIFMTEELDDDELEMEWPSGVLSSLHTERNAVNQSIGLLRVRERTT